MKKINIFLPFYLGIAGGYKVIYQYSNFLSENNCNITIYYDLNDGNNTRHVPKIIMRIIKRLLLLGYPYYFKLDKKIKQKVIRRIDEKYIEKADINIATAPTTAYLVNKLKEESAKIYFIQGYENWGNSTDFLHETYKSNMKKIVISKWLKEKVDEYSSNKAIIVNNGINLSIFNVQKPIEERKKHSVCMIYRNGDNKACQNGINVILKLKKVYSDLSFCMCGDVKRNPEWPKWFEYKKDATEKDVAEMMNNNSIFICTSLVEGFGLPGIESMACGCALVTTNCFGPLEYANDSNAIICTPGDEKSLYDSIEQYLIDDQLRISKAQNGHKTAQNWNMENSKEKFMKAVFNDK